MALFWLRGAYWTSRDVVALIEVMTTGVNELAH
jgi:hypothetical protein